MKQTQTKIGQRPPDEQLFMQSFRSGCTDAFAFIYDQLHPPLTCFVRRLVFSRVADQDIVASAFVKLYQNRKMFGGYVHIRRWMFVTVRNESMDLLRERSKEKLLRKSLAYSAVSEDEPATVDMKMVECLRREIKNLPRQSGTVLQLYYLDEKSTRQIAKLLGLSTQTVLNHKSKALRTLRERIERPISIYTS